MNNKWLEWIVIFLSVAGIAIASASALTLVIDRVEHMDVAMTQLAASPNCAAPAEAKGPAPDPYRERTSALVCLEQAAMQRRYQLTALLVESRVWTRLYACVAGFLLIAVGSAFIIMKVREGRSELGAGAQGLNFALKSASPGLIMTVLGTVIVSASVVTVDRAQTRDTAAYLSDLQFVVDDDAEADDAGVDAAAAVKDMTAPPKD